MCFQLRTKKHIYYFKLITIKIYLIYEKNFLKKIFPYPLIYFKKSICYFSSVILFLINESKHDGLDQEVL